MMKVNAWHVVPTDEQAIDHGSTGQPVEEELRAARRQIALLRRSNASLRRRLGEAFRRESEARIHAGCDELTGLPNRRQLQDRLRQALANARRAGRRVVVLLIDLNEFKEVNDTLGHAAGDDLLRQVSQRLRNATRESDTVARYGGDEFVLVLGGVDTSQAVEIVADKVRSCFTAGFVVNNRELHVSGSMGQAVFPDDGESWDLLVGHADAAMYREKDRHAKRRRAEFM